MLCWHELSECHPFQVGTLGGRVLVPLELRQCWTTSLASALRVSLKLLEDIYSTA